MPLFDEPERALRYCLERLDVRYRERSGWQAIRCISPTHSDRHTSASLNLSKGRFRCHACGLAGDGYDMLKELLNITATQFHAGEDFSTKEEDVWL